MSEYTFEVPGDAVPKQSTRFGRGHAYPDKRVQQYSTKVKFYAMNAIKELRPWFADSWVSVQVTCYLGTRRRVDVDNLAKNIKDSLKGVAYVDDYQVTDLHSSKRYDPARPRTVVRITEGVEFGGAT